MVWHTGSVRQLGHTAASLDPGHAWPSPAQPDAFVAPGRQPDSPLKIRLTASKSARDTPAAISTAVPIRTHANTVGDLLKEKNITLKEGDTVQPAPAEKLTASSQIFVIRKGKQVVSQEQEIPAPKEEVEDPNLSYGTTAVRQQGVAGKKNHNLRS